MALRFIATNFGDRMRVAILFPLAAVLWMHVGQAVFNHAPWGYYIYLWISDLVSFLVAGAIISRWFLPKQLPGAA